MKNAFLPAFLSSPPQSAPELWDDVATMVEAHPYSYMAHLFLAKLAKDLNRPEAEILIKHAAVYAHDRALLRQYLNNGNYDAMFSPSIVKNQPEDVIENVVQEKAAISLPVAELATNFAVDSDEILQLIAETKKNRQRFQDEIFHAKASEYVAVHAAEMEQTIHEPEVPSSFADDFLGAIAQSMIAEATEALAQDTIHLGQTSEEVPNVADAPVFVLHPLQNQDYSEPILTESYTEESFSFLNPVIEETTQLDNVISHQATDFIQMNSALDMNQAELQLDFIPESPFQPATFQTIEDYFATASQELGNEGVQAGFHISELWSASSTMDVPSPSNELETMQFEKETISTNEATITHEEPTAVSENIDLVSQDLKESAFAVSSPVEISQKNLIDEFLEKNPVMTTLNPFAMPNEPLQDLSEKSTVLQDNNLATESLAMIYAKQGKTQKAIETYLKLSLKFPEKTTYFASQIEALIKGSST